MPLPAVYARSLIVSLVLAAIFQAGCANALGPGFGHAARQIAIAPASAGPIHIRVTDDLVNIGIRDLAFLDVGLPPDSAATPNRLAVHHDGRELQAAALVPGGPARVKFDSPWQPQSRQTIVFDYDLQPQVSPRGIIASAPNGFAVVERAAFPAWQTPSGIFAVGDSRAHRESVEITAPADFRVLAPGREKRKVVRGANVVHQFVALRRRADPAYEIAGNYQQLNVRASHEDVVFWTFQPLDASQAQLAASRLGAAESVYRKLFDPIPVSSPVRIVEMPAQELQPEVGAGITAASFPGGVLLDARSLTQGIAGEPVLERAEYELARTWFGWYVRAVPEAEPLLGRGMSWYAVTRAEAARGGEAARNVEIARLVADYDAAQSLRVDAASAKLPADVAAQRETAEVYRSALFLVMLEDTAGRDDFDRAVRRVLHAVGGQEVETADLRSALEAATGRDLAQMFRSWFNTPGIPDEFRKRYGAGSQVR